VQFRILGPVEIEAAGEIISLRRRERCLLGVLLLHANQIVAVDRLGELLWEEDPPKRLRGTVQGVVSRLRTAIGDVAGVDLAFVGYGYRLAVDLELVDAHRFRALRNQAQRTNDLPARIALLRTAVDLWRGPALADTVSGSARNRLCADLEEQRLTAIEDLMSGSLALRMEREILPELARISGNHPGRERLIELHMLALYQAGRRVDALEVYAHARSALADEFGLDPGPELSRLHQAVLRDELTIPARTGQPDDASPSGSLPTSSKATSDLNVVPRQLPADVAGFAGRAAYLDQLDRLLPEIDRGPASIVISAIGGTAGIGKTALAVHWAHRVADRFPDGQLYINLRGFEPGRLPVSPNEAVRALLDGLQVPPQRVPEDFDSQVGLYRSLLAERRMLVVLDNARDAEQVRPLLPGASGCVAVVTSRMKLLSLVATHGAHPVTLEPLSREEARLLLARRLGTSRVADDHTAVEDIINRCGGLPLALAITAARAAGHPNLSLNALARELHAADARLDSLRGDDAATDLRVLLSLSYNAASADAARLFRLLVLHPGPDIGFAAIVSLAGLPHQQVKQLLTELVHAHLLEEPAPTRYALHDLLRAYAAELAHDRDDRYAATRRILDHYVHTANAAGRLIFANRRPILPSPPLPGVAPEELVDADEAYAWLSAERLSVLGAINVAIAADCYEQTWFLVWSLSGFLEQGGYWPEQIAAQKAAIDAAKRLVDPAKQALALVFLGRVYARLGEPEESIDRLRHALDLFKAIDDLRGQSSVHVALGRAHEKQGRYREALNHAQSALDLNRTIGDRVAEASSLNGIGWEYAQLGEYERALDYCRQALDLHRELGRHPGGEADAWDSLGYSYHHLGDHKTAIDCFGRALDLFRQLGNRYYEADTLTHLGNAQHDAGDLVAAREAWRLALDLLDELSHPDAQRVRAKLHPQ
jgi:DNA-binding SARP family transcriptional activator/tetratricopeptide (TPR) repeat protein